MKSWFLEKAHKIHKTLERLNKKNERKHKLQILGMKKGTSVLI
jgi:hypothetical protein